MTIPRAPAKTTYSVIYTDAYFKLGSTTYKPGDPDIPNWDPGKTAEIENGWAAVCFHHGDVQRAADFQGRLLSVLARQFSSDQAFIYLLEAWVAILAPLIFEPWLDSFYVQCCDNEASRHALLKGVGEHQPHIGHGTTAEALHIDSNGFQPKPTSPTGSGASNMSKKPPIG